MNGQDQDPAKPKYSAGNPYAPAPATTQEPPKPAFNEYSPTNPFAVAPTQPSYTPDDEFADAFMKQYHPGSRLIPKEVRVGLAHAGREVVGGAIEFFKKFIDSPPSLEKLRFDLEHFDYGPMLTGAGQQVGQTPQQEYGSKENLQRLIHRSIIARAEGRELTPNDAAMAFVPPYAVANMLYSTASRILDAPAILVGAQAVPPGSTKLREITTALTSGLMQGALVAGGAKGGAEVVRGRLAALRPNVISTKVEASQAAVHIESVNTFSALQRRLAEGPSPELAAIKERLTGQETANVTSTLINAHRELNPEGVSIIPGVTNPAKALGLARRAGVSSDIVTYLRPDGTYDMALYGKESALSLGANRASFQKFGYFEGQEAAINGTRVAFMGPAEGGAIKVRVIASGQESWTSLDQLRRVPFNNSSIIPTEIPTSSPIKLVRTPNILDVYGDTYTIKSGDTELGTVTAKYNPKTKDIYVDWVTARGEPPTSVADIGAWYNEKGQLGVSKLRQIGSLLTELYPEAQTISGERASGLGAKSEVHPVSTYPISEVKSTGPQAGGGIFTRFRAAVKPVSVDQLYTDFSKFRDDISTGRNPAESVLGGLVSFPDVSDLQRGPLVHALEAAKRYHTKGEIVSEFVRQAQEDNVPITPEVLKRIEIYAGSVEQHSLYTSPERLVKRFAETRGIHPDDVPALQNYIGQRLGSELRSQHMSPEELEIFNNAQKELSGKLNRPAGAFETLGTMEQLPLAQAAASNGYRVSSSPNNAIILTELNGRELGRFHTESSAREFINRSGQTDAPSVITPTNIPEATGGAAMPPGGGKLPPTYGPEDGLDAMYDASDMKAGDKGLLGKLLDTARAAADMLTSRGASFESVDNLFGSKFASVQRKLRGAHDVYMANARAFAEKYLDHIGVMLKGLKKEQFVNVFRYIEAKSPGELTAEMWSKGRGEAVEIARTLADLRVDSSKAIEFSRKVEGIKGDMKGQPQDAINMEIEKLRAAMGLDDAHVVAGGIYEGLRKRDINTVPIHEIARLSDALMWDAPGRAEFAKIANMTPKEILIAKQFDNLFEQAAKINGLPDFRIVSGYISHIRSQLGGDLPTPEASVLFQKGLGDTMEGAFASEFVRTGELSALELNPYVIAMKYIDSAFKARDFVPTYRESLAAWDVELNKLQGGAFTKWIAKEMKNRVERYASDLRGFPAPTNAVIRAGINAINKHLGSNMSPVLVENLTRRIMQWTSTALLAFRPYIGLKHFGQFEQFAGVRFGFKAMHEGLRLAEEPGAIEGLKSSGVMRGLSFTALVTPEEATVNAFMQAGGDAWKAYEKFAEVGHAATLLPTIYEHTYSAVYLGMRKLALDNLNLLSEGKLGKIRAYDNLALDSFAPSFRAEFDGLVRAGKIDEAAGLISKRAADETIFDYQASNAPKGWNSIQGKMLTMFGTWSLHASELVNNMITRGSIRHRVNYMARFAGAQAATYLAGRAIGVDLLGATVAHSLFWSGSPQWQLLQTTVTAINGQGVEQELAQSRLFKLVPGLKVTTIGGEKRFEFDFDPKTVDPRSMFIPGSYALGDWMQAIQEHNDPWGRFTLPQQGARALGVPTIKHKSWIDDYMERWGLHFYDYKTTVQQ